MVATTNIMQAGPAEGLHRQNAALRCFLWEAAMLTACMQGSASA